MSVKRLMLMRHAKSSWDEPELSDEARPLTKRGRKAAVRMADHIAAAGLTPSVVLCSSAARARETAELLHPALPPKTQIKVEPRLYEAGSSQLLTRIKRLSPGAASVLIVGHNPAMQELVLELAAKSPKVKEIRAKFPTAALAVLEAEVDAWNEITPGDAKLVHFATPKGIGP